MEGLDPSLREKCKKTGTNQVNVILLTCKCVRQHGRRFLDMLKEKLSSNPLYNFLNSDSDLYPLYSTVLNLNESSFRNILLEMGLDTLYKGSSALNFLNEYHDSDSDSNNDSNNCDSILTKKSISDSSSILNDSLNSSISDFGDIINSEQNGACNTEDNLSSIARLKKADRLKKAKSLVSYFSEFLATNSTDDTSITSTYLMGNKETVSSISKGGSESGGLDKLFVDMGRKKRESVESKEESDLRSGGRRRVDSEVVDKSSRQYIETKENVVDVLNSFEIESRISQAAENIICSRYSNGVEALIRRAVGNVNFKLGKN